MKNILLFAAILAFTAGWTSKKNSSTESSAYESKVISRVETSIHKSKAVTQVRSFLYEYDQRSRIIGKDTYKIRVSLIVNVKSRDSIMVEVTISNDSSESIELYEPILPSEDMTENSFSLLYKNFYSVEKIHTRNTGAIYYEGTRDLLPSVIPILGNDYFIELRPGQKLVFSLNIAKMYDFAKPLRHGIHNFSIAYAMFFPVVKNLMPVFENDIDDHINKPVFLYVSSFMEGGRGLRRVEFRVK